MPSVVDVLELVDSGATVVGSLVPSTVVSAPVVPVVLLVPVDAPDAPSVTAPDVVEALSVASAVGVVEVSVAPGAESEPPSSRW